MKNRGLFLLVIIGILFLSICSVSAQMIKSAVKTIRERQAATLLEKAEEMAMELNLNLEQKLKFIEIKQKTREEVDKLLGEASDKLHVIQQKEKAAIQEMLTPEQREKFSEPEELLLEDEDDLLKIYRTKD